MTRSIPSASLANENDDLNTAVKIEEKMLIPSGHIIVCIGLWEKHCWIVAVQVSAQPCPLLHWACLHSRSDTCDDKVRHG